jgi:branched-chain amino acid transport system substrate-binding protein
MSMNRHVVAPSRRQIVVSGAALAGSLAAPRIGGAQARPIRIGLLHPVTGFVAYSGAQSRLGGQIAIDEVNAAGGIRSMGGARLEAVLGDTQAKVEIGVAEVEKMNEAGVAAIVGCFQSAIVLATTQAAAKYGIPYAVDVGASDLITSRGLKNVFRLKPGFGKCVDEAIKALGGINGAAGGPAKSAVIVHESSEFGTGTAKLLADRLPGINVEVKEVIKHDNPTRNFDNVALRIRSLKPDVLMMSNYQNEYVLLARTLHQQKVDLAGMFSVLGGGFNYKFAKDLPDVAEHMMDYNHWFSPTNPKGQAMKKKVEAMGTLFTFEVYLAYNAVMLIADALERAGSADKEKLTAALAASTWADHFMPYGPTRFVDGQNQGGEAAALQVQKGDIEVVYPAQFASAKPVFPKPKFG